MHAEALGDLTPLDGAMAPGELDHLEVALGRPEAAAALQRWRAVRAGFESYPHTLKRPDPAKVAPSLPRSSSPTPGASGSRRSARVSLLFWSSHL